MELGFFIAQLELEHRSCSGLVGRAGAMYDCVAFGCNCSCQPKDVFGRKYKNHILGKKASR